MKIIVFGASGMVGQQIINQAIAHGHTAVAFGRNVFEKFSTERTHLQLFRGALFSQENLKDALKGCDAVLSAIGGDVEGTDKARSLGMKNIVAAMERWGPRRIIGIGGLGVLNADENSYRFEKPDYPSIYKAVALEHFQAYLHLKNSALDWTFLCPPNILPGEPTGEYNLCRDYHPEGRFEINAGDLADFMVKELGRNEYIGCRVGIAARNSP
jgi:hypothetical protein